VPPAGSEIRKVRFIKSNDGETVFLEPGVLQSRVQIRLQPIVGGRERAVVPVTTEPKTGLAQRSPPQGVPCFEPLAIAQHALRPFVDGSMCIG
jgi:hypothetical protein